MINSVTNYFPSVQSLITSNTIKSVLRLITKVALVGLAVGIVYHASSKAYAWFKGKKVTKIDPKNNKSELICKLKNLEENLNKKVFGQQDVIRKIKNKFFEKFFLPRQPDKPLASFFFVGPTGVGKTMLAESMAEEFKIPCMRLDMAEYQHPETAPFMLLGAASGLINSNKKSAFIDFISKNPKSIIIFDEIEKADNRVLKLFLSMLDKGEATDIPTGSKLSLREIILIFTSNLGSNLEDAKDLKGNFKSEKLEENIITAVEDHLSPEFIGRLNSGFLFFKPALGEDIFSKKLDEIIKNLQIDFKKQALEFEITDEAKKNIISSSSSNKLGFRVFETNCRDKIISLISQAVFNDVQNNKELDQEA